jgi:hypothetical protein
MGDFIRIPPDSTGKMIRHREMTDIYYSNPTLLVGDLKYNDLLVGSISGVSGRYSSINLVSMEIFIFDVTGTFQVGEDILYLGNIIARFDSQKDLYIQVNHLVDQSNPDFVLKIDKQGSMYTRSREGEQPFDSYGYSQVSMAHKIADHVFTYSGNNDSFFIGTASGGYVEHNSSLSSNILNVSSISGSSVYKTSYISYPYVPGNGTFMSTSLSCGDSGKDGVVRRWGLFDEEDGVYFELDGLTFSVNIRNSITGLTNTVIQDDFDETLPYVLDFSKFNLYWMDYQWQGVGRVRFGIYNPDGSRQLLHVIKNANSGPTPYMRRGTLPFRMEMYNKYNTSSASQLLITCISVTRQGASSEALLTAGQSHMYTSEVIQVGSSGHTPFLSAMPKQYFNGVTNRTVTYPTSFEVTSIGAPVRMDAFFEADLIGASYSVTIPGSSLFIDNTATGISNGIIADTFLFAEGTTYRENNEVLKNTLTLFPNLYQPTLSFAFKSLIPGVTASVIAVLRWKEAY